MPFRKWTQDETAYFEQLLKDKEDAGASWHNSKSARKKLTKKMNEKFPADRNNCVFFRRYVQKPLKKWIEAHPRAIVKKVAGNAEGGHEGGDARNGEDGKKKQECGEQVDGQHADSEQTDGEHAGKESGDEEGLKGQVVEGQADGERPDGEIMNGENLDAQVANDEVINGQVAGRELPGEDNLEAGGGVDGEKQAAGEEASIEDDCREASREEINGAEVDGEENREKEYCSD
ncbi:hypothetical protein DID88_010489 [Monilinia fructigena]|uniref:Uncharacterized protein n=1 Tax=Monilinia fructigena TaxID=38457 RepID=A0A395ILJ5_9HELO|nr:hypothetical protein DID88_010489 [Monilinia fructigena]